ncbi:MAG: TonB-dependent receptor, partial [Gemmatimonadetes bacterium]|nr:TonB-dependent receptor [Gemmatimonadota bacterium]
MGVQLRTTLLALFALFLVAARPASAQNGSISGKITDAESGAAVVGAQVAAETFGGRIAASALSNERGEYALRNLAPGMYTVSVSSLGYTQQRIASVNVQPAANTAVDARMQPGVFLHDPITVSVSRRQEKATEAPASVAVIDAQAVAERPTVTPLEHIRTTPGVDILTHGLQSGNVVVRGFNNIFSTTLHMLTDNRLASVPSLRVNLFHFVPATDQDIERMEVVLGPGSALYGPNTANGVLHVITKSPLDHQGTTVSIGNGFQVSDALDGNRKPVWLGAFRTAHKLSDNFGFKLSGQYLSGSEWPYSDPREITAQQQIDATYLQRTCLSTDESFKATCIADIPSRLQRIGNRDFDIERWSVEARADWRSAGGFNTIFAYGRSVEESGIELTGVGAAQAKGWAYSYYQARANYNRWFGQIYLNTSDAGDTFLLTDGALIVDESKLLVAQLQHGFSWGERQDFTYGIDYFRTMPETKGTINGNNEDDDVTDEIGGYLQSETSLSPKLDLVLAGRVDNHSELEDVVFSPRAGIVFKPRDDHAVRLMYNRAFSTPANFSLWLDLNSGPVPNAALAALGFNLRAQGVTRDGISLHMSDNSLGMRSPFTPSSLGGPGQLLPGDANTLAGYWKAAVNVLAAGAAQQGQPLPAQLVVYMRDVLSPTGADLGITGLDINTQELGSLDDLVQDVPQLKPTTTNSVE